MIIGVDLGARRLALACPERRWVATKSFENALGKRMHPEVWDAGAELGEWATWQLGKHFPNLPLEVYAERPHVGKSARTAVIQGLSAGACLSRMPGSITLIEHPALWKKATVGNGNAKKPDVARWLQEHHPTLAEACGEDQDAIDACCIALYGAAVAPAG